MDAKTLKGIAVVSVKDGEKVGTVQELVFNPETRRIMALRLGRTGLFGSSRDIILMDDVETIGRDAVMIPNRDAVRQESDERDLQGRPGLKQLGDLRVVTQDGTYVGNLATVHIDHKSGAISQVDVGSGDLMHMFRKNLEVPASEVISMGGDVVIIPNSYAPGQPDEEPDQPAESDRPEAIQ